MDSSGFDDAATESLTIEGARRAVVGAARPERRPSDVVRQMGRWQAE
jgi:hypothetical protein